MVQTIKDAILLAIVLLALDVTFALANITNDAFDNLGLLVKAVTP